MRNHFLRAASNVASGSSATTFMPLGSSDMTYEIWANPLNYLQAPFGLNRLTSSNATLHTFAFLFALTFFNGIIIFNPSTGTGDSSSFNTGANTYSTSAWQHLVFTHDASTGTVKVYRNSSLIKTNTDTTKWSSYPNNNSDTYFLTVGRGGYQNGTSFDGNISIVRIYKGKALTASEVTQNYNAEKGRYTNASSSGTHVTSNLVFHIDAGNTNSYSGSGATTVNSLVGGISSSSYNSNISHSTSDGGYWTFTSSTGLGIKFDSI